MAKPRVGSGARLAGIGANQAVWDPVGFLNSLGHQYHSTFTPSYAGYVGGNSSMVGGVGAGMPNYGGGGQVGMGAPAPSTEKFFNVPDPQNAPTYNPPTYGPPSPGGNMGRSSSPADAGYGNEYQPYWNRWSRLNTDWQERDTAENDFRPGSIGSSAVEAARAENTSRAIPAWRPQLHDPGFIGGVKPKGGV